MAVSTLCTFLFPASSVKPMDATSPIYGIVRIPWTTDADGAAAVTTPWDVHGIVRRWRVEAADAAFDAVISDTWGELDSITGANLKGVATAGSTGLLGIPVVGPITLTIANGGNVVPGICDIIVYTRPMAG